VFAFTKDVKAFINYVADEWAPEDWPNPVRRIKCRRPPVFIRPLSREQLVRLFELAETTASSQIIAANRQEESKPGMKLLPSLQLIKLMAGLAHPRPPGNSSPKVIG